MIEKKSPVWVGKDKTVEKVGRLEREMSMLNFWKKETNLLKKYKVISKGYLNETGRNFFM